MNFKVESVNVSAKKGVAKKAVFSIRLIRDWGIKGDAHAGDWDRQVSLLSGEAVDEMREKAPQLDIQSGAFGENIITRGIDWRLTRIGATVSINNDVLLEITRIGKECHQPCAIQAAVGECIMPVQGVFARVIRGGTISAENSGNYHI